MRSASKKTDISGFSLVEVLIATAIFTIGALALFGLEVRMLRASAQAKWLTEATRLAQFPLEGFKAVKYTDIYTFIQDGQKSTTYVTTSTPNFSDDTAAKLLMDAWQLEFNNHFPRGIGTLKITLLDGDEKEVTETSGQDVEARLKCTVTWTSHNGAHKVELEQRIANAF